MTLPESVSLIQKAFAKMNEAYGRPVFDEWALVDLSSIQGHIHEYSGPRHAEFQKDLHDNLIPLQAEMTGQNLEPGDFSFVRDAAGADFDAFVVLGTNLYLLCNHTSKDMEQITRDPQWKRAQVPFVNLSEKFRVSPLVVHG